MYKVCRSCSKRFDVDPRVPNQQFCSNTDCQNERRRLWLKKKRSTDPDYKGNQAEAQKAWVQKNPAYWQGYREKNPDYVSRNRASQKKRNAIRKDRQTQPGVAKNDESTNQSVLISGFLRIPVCIDGSAKIDAILVRIDVISEPKPRKGDGDESCKESTL
jgi:hypothetical protein